MTQAFKKKLVAVAVGTALSGVAFGAFANEFADTQLVVGTTSNVFAQVGTNDAPLTGQILDIKEVVASSVFTVANSALGNNQIRLQLSGGAKWGSTAAPTVSFLNGTGGAGCANNTTAIDGTDPTILNVKFKACDGAQTAPTTLRLTGITIDARTATAGADLNVTVLPTSTAVGVSTGAVAKIGALANADVTIATSGTVPTVNAGDNNVTIPTIVIAENTPGAIIKTATGNDEIIVTLPTGFTFTVDSATAYTNTIAEAANPNESGTSKMTIDINAVSTAAGNNVVLGGTTAMKIFVPAGATAGDVNATVQVRVGNTVKTQNVVIAKVGAKGVSASLKDLGTAGVQKVYTTRNYAAGVNGGNLVDGVTVLEGSAASLSAGGTVTLTTSNATQGAAATEDTAGTGEFTTGAAVATSTTVTTFPTVVASTAVGNGRDYTFSNLTIGSVVGPVTVTVGGTSMAASQSPVTIANAVDATTFTPVTPVIANVNLPSVALPNVTLTEESAGVLADTTGLAGTVTLTTSNGTLNAGSTATWCGTALASSRITGAGTATLTYSLPTVSSGTACKLEVANLSLNTTGAIGLLPGQNISLTAGGTAQPTAKAIVVAQQVESDKSNFTATASGANTALTLNATADVAQNHVGSQGQLFVGALLAGKWFMLTPTGWQLWTTGNAPAYSAGPLADTTIKVLDAANVSALVGAQVYVGYGIGANAATEMLNAGRYGLVYTVK